MSTTDQQFTNYCDKVTGVFLKNPVVAYDGYIYEKDPIEKLIAESEIETIISPFTGLAIKKGYIVPIEYVDRLNKFYVEHPEFKEKQYGNVVDIKIQFDTLITSEINEENVNKMLTLLSIKQETPIIIANEDWFKALINTEKGIDYYATKNYVFTVVADNVNYQPVIKFSTKFEYYVKVFNQNMKDLFYCACFLNNLEICQYIYNLNNEVIRMEYPQPLFLIAAASAKFENSIKVLEFLHSKNDKLYLEICGANSVFVCFILNDLFELVKFMLTIDKSLYKTEKLNGKSVFYYACINGRMNILKYLYSIDANVYNDETDKTGLLSELKTTTNYTVVLPFILEIITKSSK